MFGGNQCGLLRFMRHNETLSIVDCSDRDVLFAVGRNHCCKLFVSDTRRYDSYTHNRGDDRKENDFQIDLVRW